MHHITFRASAFHTEGLDHKRLWQVDGKLVVENLQNVIDACLEALQRNKKMHPDVATYLASNQAPTSCIDSEFEGYTCIILMLESCNQTLYIDYKEDGNDN